MAKLKNWSLNMGYPVYGAQFVTDNILIVAGGGGDGNNGIPNKMTAVLIQPQNEKKPIKRYRELTLNDNEDSVMSLGVGSGIILAGINENPLMMAKGVNKHLRKFKFENDHLKFLESCQIHPNTSSTIYQKITAISRDGLIGVIVMSDTPSSIYIVETSVDLEEKYKIVTEGDVKDVTISLDGKLMCYITSNVFEVISLVTGRSVFKTNIKFLMSKVRFLDNNEVLISGSKGKDVVIAKFLIATSKIVQQKVVFKNLKGITSMDVNVKNNLTVLATSSYSLLIIRTSDLKVIKILNKVHEFAITKAVFSDNGKYLASTSAANTINVVEIPDNFAASKSILATIFQYIFSIILIALVSITAQFLYENGYIDIAINKAVEAYENFKPQDSSNYFTVESIISSESSIKAPSSSAPIKSKSSSSKPLKRPSSSRSSKRKPLSSQASSVQSSIDDTVSLSSEVLQSVLSKTSSVVKKVSPSSSSSSSSVSRSLKNSPADATVKDDIVSSHDLSTTDMNISTTKESLQKLKERNVTSQASSPSIKEVTKVKEVTSVIVQTQFSTSTALVTSVKTSVETSVQTSVMTSVVVVTVTQEPEITKSTPHAVDSPLSHNVEIEKVENANGEDEYIVVDDNEVVIETLADVKINPEIETLISTVTVTPTSESTEFTTTSDSFSIQIEPTKEIYENAEEAAEKEGDKIRESLVSEENEIESSTSASASASTGDLSIQIEPSSVVYKNAEEAEKAQNELIEKELKETQSTTQSISSVEESQTSSPVLSSTSTSNSISEVSIQIEPSSIVYENAEEAQKAQNEVIEKELKEAEFTTSQGSASVEETNVTSTSSLVKSSTTGERAITAIKPIVMLQQEAPDSSSAESTSSTETEPSHVETTDEAPNVVEEIPAAEPTPGVDEEIEELESSIETETETESESETTDDAAETSTEIPEEDLKPTPQTLSKDEL